MGTGTEKVPEPGIFHISGGIGTGIEKIWYRKKVSEPVSRKFGTKKRTGIGIENIWYRTKVSISVSFNIFGTVTHWYSVLCIQCVFIVL